MDLEFLYNHLEEKAIDYRQPHQIAELFSRVLDRLRAEQKHNEEVKAQHEVNIFYFNIEDSFVKPSWAMRSSQRKDIYYNDSMFTDSLYEYLNSRLDSTKNPVLRARYAHLLWLSPKKHGKYVKVAVDAYLELVKSYEQKDIEIPDQFFGLKVITSIKNAFYLSPKLRDKVKTDIIKKEVVRLIFNYNSRSTSLFALRANLIELMLDEPVFSKDDFAGMTELCFSFAQELLDGHKSITLLKLGERIDQKRGSTTYRWKQQFGEAYEKLMVANMEKNKFVALSFCKDALYYYRQVKDAGRIDALEHVYKELKGKIEFPVLVVRFDLQMTEDYKKKAETITQCSVDDIIKTLMFEKELLPTYCQMEKVVDDLSKIFVKEKIAPVSIVDARGHSAQHFTTEEQKYPSILRQYKWELETKRLPLINLIIVEAVRTKKITFSSLMTFFRENLWFGKELVRKSYVNKSYNWLNLLAPSILDLFNQTENSIVSGNRPNLVLCIDSLTLKIEGLIRDLCDNNDIVTFTPKRGSEDNYEEKDLNKLLYDKKVVPFFDIDDLLFFKFVLIEQAGYNLRNKVAHSLMDYEDYQESFAYLLLLILLKLGKYDCPQNDILKNSVKK